MYPVNLTIEDSDSLYLPGRGDTMIMKVVYRVRLIHCTPDVLTPAISPNVVNSTA